MPAPAYVRGLTNALAAEADPGIAEGQARYMRDQFRFLGLKTPARNAVLRAWIQREGLPPWSGPLESAVRACFRSSFRELHYAGLHLLEKSLRLGGPEAIELLEELALTHSWWDTVDWIAKLAGIHFRRYPAQIRPVTGRWMDSGEIWLQRLALIFQLSYREKTDRELLFGYILRIADSREFFLQKGAGWALRQYARTNPDAVLQFVQEYPLPALTRREALKHIA
jgi:3-methyladenine DNA glycosylase AlkD